MAAILSNVWGSKFLLFRNIKVAPDCAAKAANLSNDCGRYFEASMDTPPPRASILSIVCGRSIGFSQLFFPNDMSVYVVFFVSFQNISTKFYQLLVFLAFG